MNCYHLYQKYHQGHYQYPKEQTLFYKICYHNNTQSPLLSDYFL